MVCPELSVPQNGNIEYDNTPSEYNSEAVYSCTNGFTVDGDAMRVCQSDGTWSGNSAICQREYIYSLLL